jgi:uncharacterized protein YjiS (DUF1127 family)
MTIGVEIERAGNLVDHRAIPGQRAGATPTIAPGWTALRSLFMRWSARQRLGRSIAHMNDRVLADAGLTPGDLGLGERLIRGIGAGGTIRAIGEADYRS